MLGMKEGIMRLHLPQIGLLLLLASSVAWAAPADWTAFVQCTREHAPKRPVGPFEAVVNAGRALEKCYHTAPPPASTATTPGATGPARPAIDPKSPEDVPCDDLPKAIKQWADYLRDLDRERENLVQQISEADEAIQSLDVALGVLRENTDQLSMACHRAQARYMSKLHELTAGARDSCPRRPPSVVADCLDSRLQEVQGLLDASDEGRMFTRVCGMAREATVAFDENQRLRNRLEGEIDGWVNQLRDHFRKRGRAAAMLERLMAREKDVECRKN